MKMDLLEVFLTIAKEKSLSKAAEKLYVSQPTLSRKVKELEQELNCALFVRTSQGISLTQAGMMIYGQVQQLVDQWQQICFVAKRYGSQEGLLRIGYVFPNILPYISKALDVMAMAEGKKPHFTLTYGQAMELGKMVLDGSLDCLIVHRPSMIKAKELRAFKIVSASQCAMFYNTHPMAHTEGITLPQLTQETEIRVHRDPEYFETAAGAFILKGLTPPKYVMAYELPDCYLLMQREGCFCYRCSIYPPEPDFTMVRITDWPIDYDLMLVCLEGSHNIEIDPFYRAMVDVFKEPDGSEESKKAR